jgi:hypothetical protein
MDQADPLSVAFLICVLKARRPKEYREAWETDESVLEEIRALLSEGSSGGDG